MASPPVPLPAVRDLRDACRGDRARVAASDVTGRCCFGSSYGPRDAPASNENRSLLSRERDGLSFVAGIVPLLKGASRCGVRRPALVRTPRICQRQCHDTPLCNAWRLVAGRAPPGTLTARSSLQQSGCVSSTPFATASLKRLVAPRPPRQEGIAGPFRRAARPTPLPMTYTCVDGTSSPNLTVLVASAFSFSSIKRTPTPVRRSERKRSVGGWVLRNAQPPRHTDTQNQRQ